MNVREKLVANNRHQEVDAGIFVVAQKVEKADGFDTVVSEGYGLGGEPLFLKRVTDFSKEITDEDQVFIITQESWKRMTESNILLQKDE